MDGNVSNASNTQGWNQFITSKGCRDLIFSRAPTVHAQDKSDNENHGKEGESSQKTNHFENFFIIVSRGVLTIRMDSIVR